MLSKKIPFTLNIAVEVADSLETSARGKAPYIIRRLDEPASMPSTLGAAE